jgi:hypothetical protein
MANNTGPFGLIGRKQAYNGYYNSGLRAYSVPSSDATAIYVGDLVTPVGTSQIINGQVFPDVAQFATGGITCGVVVAILAQTRDTLTYRAASTQAVVLVEDDPNALFEIRQVAGGTPLTANDVGLNANIVVGSGSTYTGFSGMALDNTTEATTNTLDVKIMEIVNRADNDPGSAVGTGADSSTFLVRLNRHRYANQIAGI